MLVSHKWQHAREVLVVSDSFYHSSAFHIVYCFETLIYGCTIWIWNIEYCITTMVNVPCMWGCFFAMHFLFHGPCLTRFCLLMAAFHS
uniref:Uncharacterized protein n=1 Tax=Rhizophora mucronata TaxID=61149 RepID=A0A2P2PWA8_RHIMU